MLLNFTRKKWDYNFPGFNLSTLYSMSLIFIYSEYLFDQLVHHSELR